MIIDFPIDPNAGDDGDGQKFRKEESTEDIHGGFQFDGKVDDE